MSNNESRDGPVEVASDGARLWRTLAAAGREATAEALTEADFARLHVTDDTERFIVDRVRAGGSIVLTGNAGDGKTHLLRHVKRDLESAGAVVVEDATAEMVGGDPRPILEKWRNAVEAGQPFCLAANEYPLYQLRRADRSAPHLAEVTRQCNHRLAYGHGAQPAGTSDVVVIDLSLRNPLSAVFFETMLNKLLADEGLRAVLEHPEELAARRNVELLDHPRVRTRLQALTNRLAAFGHRATVRELWILLARMVFGRKKRGEYQRADWYSEVLFAQDDRFELTQALQAVDPAICSHPTWDAALDIRASAARDGWALRAPRPPPHPTLEWEDFAALKRRFYFEHESGEEAFELADTDSGEFQQILDGNGSSGQTLVSSLVEAINAAYCPVRFESRDQHLYLWSGHRFHEQPSRSFVAADRITTDQFVTEVPRLPDWLGACFEYRPDHIALTAHKHPGTPRLRIDFPLWRTLRQLARGLPRKLIPERDIHRLDAFLQELAADQRGARDIIWSVHLENLELIQVDLSADGRRFERVRRYG